ncbi:phosphatidylethanolamine N-methyltransferase isoform X5 [Camelus bactrianus]|uniref:Phosphatidylethanolamine N-methyltransferase isoform X5 n=1 Tax=Camelus bactrianus TaxID=9837 RepID=A0AC58NJU0_CAMBA
MGPVLGAEGCREAPARRPAPRGLGRAGPMHSLAAGPDCCGGLGNLDFRQADLCVMTRLLGYVDPSDPRFVAAVLAIAFNPLFWNVEARDWGPEEPGQRPPPDPRGRLKQGSLPRFCGRTWTSPRPAFSCYTLYPSLPGAAGGKGARGVRVARWEHKTRKLSRAFRSPHLACYTLGGAILLLNVLRSHWHASPTGLLLTAVVALIYVVAILYEEPFTAEVYRQKASQACKRS